MTRALTFPLSLGFVLALLGMGESYAQSTGPHREAPAELANMAHSRVGEWIADYRYETVDGKQRRLSQSMGERGMVIAMRSVDCPVSKRYGQTLARLESEFQKRGLGFIFVNASRQDTKASVVEEIQTFGFQGDYVHEAEEPNLIVALGATTTSEVFLLDSARTLRYRGAVDDQYGIGYAKAEPSASYLAEAVEALLTERTLSIEATSAPGCVLGIADDDPPPTAAEVTYHNRISRIMQRNCQTCHRADGAGPFPLETYDQVSGFGSMIDYVIEKNIMPPWFADEDTGHWANERRLSERDRDAIRTWVRDGTPGGDTGDAPLSLSWNSGWSISEPDAVFQIPEAFEVPAQGVVDYRYVYVKTDFPEDRWVQEMEILPTAPQVTHHVLVFLEEPGRKGYEDKSRKPEEPSFQGGLQGYFASTVPGQQPSIYARGMAKRLPKGSWLKFQIHYTPIGKPAIDQTKIGFVFADEPPQFEVDTGAAFNTRFEIPPGASDHEVTGTFEFKDDVVLTAFFPHMHVRGKAFRYDLIYPDGREEPLLNIPRYDFNWQLHYRFREPLHVPAGSVIRSIAWFDNSRNNPANPDPTARVRFGEQTFEEMMIGYFDWFSPKAIAGGTTGEEGRDGLVQPER